VSHRIYWPHSSEDSVNVFRVLPSSWPIRWFKNRGSNKTIQSLLFFFAAAWLALHCYRTPKMSVDLLSYAGNAALVEKKDEVLAHQSVYAETLTSHLRGTDGDGAPARILRRRVNDPFYAATFLPYFSVKPVYVMTLVAVHRAGLSLTDTIRLVSALCYFGIALLVWVYTRSLLSLFALLLPEVLELGQANGPDAMSVFVLLLGFWFLFARHKDLGILPIVVSVWVRPENVIVAVAALAVMYFTERINWKQAAALALLSAFSFALISHFGYGWKSLYYHTFLSGDPSAPPHFAWSNYRDALEKGLADLLRSAFPLYLLLAIASFARCSERSTRTILGLSGFYFASRFLLFPSYEPRFYGLFFLCSVLAAVSGLSGARHSGAPRLSRDESPAPPRIGEHNLQAPAA
jgi:hypothetical protein